jgi:hypothetical protein
MSLPRSGFAITTNDAADLTHTITKLYVGTGGNIKLVLVKDDSTLGFVTLTAVPQGSILELAIKKIWAAGTTASNLIGFF